jgi:hypothetical protein
MEGSMASRPYLLLMDGMTVDMYHNDLGWVLSFFD